MSTHSLPTRIEKQIAGKCCYPGCTDDAIDGADYCGPHDAHERGRDAGKKRRRRQRLANAGLCTVAGCGRKIGKRKRPDGTIQQRRCRACTRKKLAREREDRAKERERKKTRGVPGDGYGVPGDSPESDRWRADPGTTWMRFRGKGRRGRLTREEQIDEDIRDIGFARAELEKLARALEQLKRPEVMDLPPIQRDAARRQAGLFIGLPLRLLEELAEKYE